MARPLRIEHEGAVYHILSYGNKAGSIFQEDLDKEYFLDVLSRAAERYGTEVYAYCIMSNHYHLLIGVPFGILSKVMHMIQSSFSSHMRRNRKRIGHIFAGRYKSLCVEKERYLLELSRYIHLNPVKASITKMPEEYNWSSYKYYIDKKRKPEWLKMQWLLQQYGKTYTVAQRKYRDFVEAGIRTAAVFPSNQIIGQALLGGKGFIEEVVKGIETSKELKKVASWQHYKGGIDLEELYKSVCQYYRINDIVRGRESSRGRAMFVYLSKRHTIALNREIGQIVGGVTFSTVAHIYARVLKAIAKDKKEKRKWEKEAEEILSSFKG